jgi:hypothetical protein
MQQMADSIRLDLYEFHLKTVLPTLDSLSARHRARMEELGIPGLGDGTDTNKLDEKGKTRVKRIMDILEAAMEED